MRHYLQVLGIGSGVVVDIAAGDGVSQSCTLPLFRSSSWSGLAVEMDPKKFAYLAYVYAGYNNSQLARCRVTPENIVWILQAHEIPRDFDVLNFDIDSYDLFVAKEMLTHGFRPKLISMEVNEKLPPPLYFTVLYAPDHYWQRDHFFGCSLVAAADTVRPFGYVLASLEYNNAIFVRSNLAQGKIADLPVSKAYDDGYRNKADRNMVFPWNVDVERALELNAEDALAFFANLFKKYQGRFELRIAAESESAAYSRRSVQPGPSGP